MKKILILIVFLLLCVSLSGCLETSGKRFVVSGIITFSNLHAVGWSGLDTVYDTTFNNDSQIFHIRSTDFLEYGIENGDNVKLELHTIIGGEYYFIYKNYVVEG